MTRIRAGGVPFSQGEASLASELPIETTCLTGSVHNFLDSDWFSCCRRHMPTTCNVLNQLPVHMQVTGELSSTGHRRAGSVAEKAIAVTAWVWSSFKSPLDRGRGAD